MIVAVGYLLLRPFPRQPWMSQALLPSEIVSLSECISTRFPDTTAIDWVKADEPARAERLDAVGVRPERHGEARAWATAEFGVTYDWPGVFYSAADAAAARARFFGEESAVELIGLGLPETWLERFIAEATPPPPEPGYSPEGESGYLKVARRREPLPLAGVTGFEPVSFYRRTIGCSWLCNGLETHCAERLGIRPGRYGLIDDLESAERCCAEISRGEVGAEPGTWFPFALALIAPAPGGS